MEMSIEIQNEISLLKIKQYLSLAGLDITVIRTIIANRHHDDDDTAVAVGCLRESAAVLHVSLSVAAAEAVVVTVLVVVFVSLSL
jgi:hypothetical protein